MKVLLGMGGGKDSQVALEQTIERTTAADDELTIAIFPSNDRSVDDIWAEVESTLAETGVDAELREIEDRPASRLVELAESEGYDQLVIGGGQRSPMGKISLGPITEFVILNAQTTVRLER